DALKGTQTKLKALGKRSARLDFRGHRSFRFEDWAVITVLRLGHRPARDKRVTTHVALTARAFGADAVLVSTRDPGLERSIRGVVRRFGGTFRIETGVAWRRILNEWQGTKVHLTMYGERLEQVLPRIPRKDLLIIVGAEKVPRELFDLVDWNVEIGRASCRE